MKDCANNGVILSRLECIATYNDDTTSIFLNYFMLVLTLYPFYLTFFGIKPKRIVTAILLLFFYFLFQFCLCLALGCAGISIIWCAVLGSSIFSFMHDLSSQRHRRSSTRFIMSAIVFAFGLSLIIYYAFTLPFITTITHLLAIVMGFATERAAEHHYHHRKLQNYYWHCHLSETTTAIVALFSRKYKQIGRD